METQTESPSRNTSADFQASAENPLTMREMMEAGVHYGHQTRRWNPKMKAYIYGARNGVHIIDLQYSVKAFRRAFNFLVNTVAANKPVLFVGTKKQAQDVIREEAVRAGQFHVTQRWLGGTLTNFKTVKGSLERLKTIEKMEEDQTILALTKKEVLQLTRERDKFEMSLGGIRDMGGLPDVIFVIDANKEELAIKEANVLGIPVVAVLDTNVSPQGIAFPVPGNDDASRAIRLYCDAVADAVLAGKQGGAAARGEDIGAMAEPPAEAALAEG